MPDNPNLGILLIVAVDYKVVAAVVVAADADTVGYHNDFAVGYHSNYSHPLAGTAGFRIAVGFHSSLQVGFVAAVVVVAHLYEEVVVAIHPLLKGGHL